jgi:hypothetical protein
LNKEKVDKIMEEVLTEIGYKVNLLTKLHIVFKGAERHARGPFSLDSTEETKQNKTRYELIEPLIDEAVEKYLNKLNQ